MSGPLRIVKARLSAITSAVNIGILDIPKAPDAIVEIRGALINYSITGVDESNDFAVRVIGSTDADQVDADPLNDGVFFNCTMMYNDVLLTSGRSGTQQLQTFQIWFPEKWPFLTASRRLKLNAQEQTGNGPGGSHTVYGFIYYTLRKASKADVQFLVSED